MRKISQPSGLSHGSVRQSTSCSYPQITTRSNMGIQFHALGRGIGLFLVLVAYPRYQKENRWLGAPWRQSRPPTCRIWNLVLLSCIPQCSRYTDSAILALHVEQHIRQPTFWRFIFHPIHIMHNLWNPTKKKSIKPAILKPNSKVWTILTKYILHTQLGSIPAAKRRGLPCWKFSHIPQAAVGARCGFSQNHVTSPLSRDAQIPDARL